MVLAKTGKDGLAATAVGLNLIASVIRRKMKTELKGTLEIDHDRGVIYFHLSEHKDIMARMVMTPLRICSLPKPIPEIQGRMLDITHMTGCDWGKFPNRTITK